MGSIHYCDMCGEVVSEEAVNRLSLEHQRGPNGLSGVVVSVELCDDCNDKVTHRMMESLESAKNVNEREAMEGFLDVE